MTGPGFRCLEVAGEGIRVEIDGRSVEIPRGVSVLGALLLQADQGQRPDWFCAIGQCQRCRVRVNGHETTACQAYPAPGDRIETPKGWSG
ncbi:2Fe-2S iron-sulfur cluster-binding protein [Spiribacter roseus]|uniref:2Fe-2S iron-sulfur cluster-binding protein n=1 Tax=Spiribacter roseus TaxID=1855875 RepID=A0ABV3RXV5_9GAMM